MSYPPDPISPTSPSECHQLFAQYQALHRQLGAAAKSKGEEAWQLVRARGSAAGAHLYREAHELYDQASEVISQGSRARSRCMAAVAAYKRNRDLAETQRTMDDLPDRAGRSVRDGMLNGALGLYAESGGIGGRGIKALRRGLTVFGGIDGLRARSGTIGGTLGVPGNAALMVYGEKAGWNVLQQRLVATSLRTVLDLHRSALADLDRVLAEIDGASGGSLQSRLTVMSRKTSVEIMGGYRGGGGSPVAPEGGDLGAAYDDAQDQSRKMVAARAESSARAMAAAAAERQRAIAAAQRRANQQHTVRRQPQTSSGGGQRRSNVNCPALADQISRQQAIVADYEGPRYSYGPQGRQWARDVERPRLLEMQAQYRALCH